MAGPLAGRQVKLPPVSVGFRIAGHRGQIL
jgi:hypothetical protein